MPLPTLVAAVLCQRNQAQQSGLDHFFANLCDRALPERVASDRAFARARDGLRPDAQSALNDRLVQRMEAAGMIPTWRGLRVVAVLTPTED